MAIKKGGLGRGINALLPQTQSEYSTLQPQDRVQDIKVDLIQPNRYQPRREFDEGALNELAESIRAYGILQPLIVRSIEGERYELIAGERRLRASKIVGLEKVPAIIRDYTDAQMSEISIIENVQRENLNVIEEAQAYERLIKEFGHTQEVVAAKIGRSRSHISNILRLLKLSPTVRALISKGLLTLGQARPLLAIENEVIQIQAAEMILSEGLSVRKVEAFINELKNSGLLANLTANLNNTNEVADSETKTVEVEKPIINKNVDENIQRNKISTSDQISNEEVKPPIKIKKNKPQLKETLKDNSQIYIREVEERLTKILGAQVKITSNKKFSRIQIDFATEDDLNRIVESFDQSLKTIPAIDKPAAPPLTTKEEKLAALRKFSTQNFNI